MGDLKFAKQVSQTVAYGILKEFVEHYVDKEKLEFFCAKAQMRSYGRDPGCSHSARRQGIFL